MTKPRLLISGASGFVGSHVLAHLMGSFELHAVSRSQRSAPGIIWHQTDMRDGLACERLVRDIRPTHLVHSSWETTHGTFWAAESNDAWLDASKALVDAFQKQGGQRLVGLGTCAEYVDSDQAISESEAGPLPQTLYGQSKLKLFEHIRGLDVSSAWLRIFYPFGASENPARFIPSVCQSLLQGKEAACSSGVQRRNFIDVRDLAEAIAQAVTRRVEGAINVGHPQSYTIAEIANMLGSIAEHPELIRLGALQDRPGEAPVLIPDLSRQANDLCFYPRQSVKAGLRDAYSYWKTQAAREFQPLIDEQEIRHDR